MQMNQHSTPDSRRLTLLAAWDRWADVEPMMQGSPEFTAALDRDVV